MYVHKIYKDNPRNNMYGDCTKDETECVNKFHVL